jgi:hypothetical protein
VTWARTASKSVEDQRLVDGMRVCGQGMTGIR